MEFAFVDSKIVISKTCQTLAARGGPGFRFVGLGFGGVSIPYSCAKAPPEGNVY
jgi:hypothetical protein